MISSGNAELILLPEARAKASVADRIDPIDERREVEAAAQEAKAKATTFAEAVRAAASWRNPIRRPRRCSRRSRGWSQRPLAARRRRCSLTGLQ